MNKFLYKFSRKVIIIGVIFFASHLLFPQYTHAYDISESQLQLEMSQMNIVNSPYLILFDPSDDDIETAHLPEPVTTTVTTATTNVVKKVNLAKNAGVAVSKEEIREFIRLEAIRAGLNPDEAEKIVKCESGFNPQAVNNKNRNGSRDLGLWQINSVHKKISDADKLDYKEATKWAITKRLHDGNWSAWYCARRLAIK